MITQTFIHIAECLRLTGLIWRLDRVFLGEQCLKEASTEMISLEMLLFYQLIECSQGAGHCQLGLASVSF